MRIERTPPGPLILPVPASGAAPPPSNEPCDQAVVGRSDYAGDKAAEYSRQVNFTRGPDQAVTARYLETIPRWLTGKYVVDLACGGGELPNRELAAREPRQIVGVDISPEFIAQAIREAPAYPSTRYVVGDMRRLTESVPPSSADLMTSRFGVHYADPQELPGVFQEIAATLKPGGEFIFLTNMAHGQEGDDVPPEVRAAGTLPIQLTPTVRVNNFAHSRQDYLKAMERAGLEVVSMESTPADDKIAADYPLKGQVHLDATIVVARKPEGWLLAEP